MEVLEHWRPNINWSQFDQGPISYAMWSGLTELVVLCHVFKHWERRVREMKASSPAQHTFPPESRHEFQQREDQWRADIREKEKHMHRAGFLADEKLARMSYLIGPDDKDTPDYKLCLALRCAIPVGSDSRWRAAAFDAFNAGVELEANVAQIAQQWLRNAKYIC